MRVSLFCAPRGNRLDPLIVTLIKGAFIAFMLRPRVTKRVSTSLALIITFLLSSTLKFSCIVGF